VGSLLVQDWLADAPSIAVVDQAAVSLVREAVRRAAAGRLEHTAAESLVSAASELAHNQLRHAGSGQVAVRAIERAGVVGVEVIAADPGPGIAAPTAALRGELASPGGLGAGLSAAARLCDELDIDVRRGEGTCLWARKYASPLPRSEIAILGRCHRDEQVSGDHAAFARVGDRLVLAVIDGLGHGSAARAASDPAARLVRDTPGAGPADVLRRCDDALRPTRGAAMAVLELDLAHLTALHAGAGNVATHLYQGRDATRFTGAARVVGGHRQSAALREEPATLAARHVVVMFSDGLSNRLDLADPVLRLQHPLIIADDLLTRFGQANDDALVLVARLS